MLLGYLVYCFLRNKGSDLMKVRAANALYQAAVTLLEIAGSLSVASLSRTPLGVGFGCCWLITSDNHAIGLSLIGIQTLNV